MSVSNYTIENKYLIKDLDNWIYLYQFNEPILNYITDDGTLNASASDIMGSGYKVYCENVSYTSNSNINSRFSFENTLTLTIVGIDIELLNAFVLNDWMVLFKNKNNNVFILNAEYPIDVTYQYNINDENTPNSLTITLKSLSNTPIINFSGNLNYTILREKPCGYNHSMIKRLRMLETTKGFISTSDNKIDVYMYRDTLKIIDFNHSSLSFTDSFNGDTYEQTLSFEIPLINHQFYFHYNILEYINNRYYCIVETTDGKYIVGGYKSGMFPSYAIEGNNIKITLTTNITSNNTLIADYISFNEIEYNHCVGIDGECIDGLWTYKLIQRLELNGSVSNEYYALNGYENDYSDINIIGTYNRFDTTFGIKLTNPLYDCFKQCYISGLPSSLIFKNTGETQCFTIESDCDFTYTYDITIIDASFNEDTNEFCVKSLKMDSSTQIKIITSDGINRFINIVIGTVGGEQGEYERQYRWFYNGETYCLGENQQINCESAKTTTDTITSGVCTYYKTELYISPLCDSEYYFYDYGIGDLISCEKIYRWVLSDNESDYYCDENTYTKYALEYEEYSDDNGLTWVRTDNTRQSSTVLETGSDDCGYNNGNPSGDTNTIFRWVVSYNPNFYYCDYITNTKYAIEYQQYSVNNGLTWLDSKVTRKTNIILETNSYDCGYVGTDSICSDELSFTLALTNNNTQTFKINKKTFYVNETPFTTTLTELGIDKFTDASEMFYPTNRLETVSKIPCTDNVTDMFSMFESCPYLVSINATKTMNTSNVTDMVQMFNGCYSLTELDLSSFNTSNVTNMSSMFWGCSSLTSLDLSNFNTSKVTDMTQMFRECTDLAYLDLSSFDTSNVNSMQSMFGYCNSFTELDLSNFDTSKVTTMYCMFYACTNLAHLNLSSFNTSNVTNMENMFTDCWGLTELDLSSFDTSKVTTMSEMFKGCNSLTSLDLSSFDTSSLINTAEMFYNCSGLTSLDLSSFNTSNVTDMSDMFRNCNNLISLDLSNWNLSNLTKYDGIFDDCEKLETITMYNCPCDTVIKMKVILIENGMLSCTVYHDEVCNDAQNVCGNEFMIYKYPSFPNLGNTITVCNGDVCEYPILMQNPFIISLTDLGIDTLTYCQIGFDCVPIHIPKIPCTDNVTDMSHMFYKSRALISLDATKTMNTSNVTNMQSMFFLCNNLTSLDLSSFDTSKVTNMRDMFNNCTSLTELDLSSFNTSNVTDMCNMFSHCNRLTSLDLSNFDTSNVTDMDYMFDGCNNLTTIKVTNCSESTISKLQEALTDAGYSSTVSNGIITVTH